MLASTENSLLIKKDAYQEFRCLDQLDYLLILLRRVFLGRNTAAVMQSAYVTHWHSNPSSMQDVCPMKR